VDWIRWIVVAVGAIGAAVPLGILLVFVVGLRREGWQWADGIWVMLRFGTSAFLFALISVAALGGNVRLIALLAIPLLVAANVMSYYLRRRKTPT
jgi:hypothetical protein